MMKRRIYFKPWVKKLPKMMLIFTILVIVGCGIGIIHDLSKKNDPTFNKIAYIFKYGVLNTKDKIRW